jgi:hypothetical protein
MKNLRQQLHNGDVLPNGTKTPAGWVRGHRCIEAAEGVEEAVNPGIWYIVEKNDYMSASCQMRWLHEKTLLNLLEYVCIAPRKAG